VVERRERKGYEGFFLFFRIVRGEGKWMSGRWAMSWACGPPSASSEQTNALYLALLNKLSAGEVNFFVSRAPASLHTIARS
jgi:hypothetical protein